MTRKQKLVKRKKLAITKKEIDPWKEFRSQRIGLRSPTPIPFIMGGRRL